MKVCELSLEEGGFDFQVSGLNLIQVFFCCDFFPIVFSVVVVVVI